MTVPSDRKERPGVDKLRAALIASVNGYEVTPDEGWALIRHYDDAERYEKIINEPTERHEDCDMGDDGGPCDTCLSVRVLAARVERYENAMERAARWVENGQDDRQYAAELLRAALAGTEDDVSLAEEQERQARQLDPYGGAA